MTEATSFSVEVLVFKNDYTRPSWLGIVVFNFLDFRPHCEKGELQIGWGLLYSNASS